METLLTIAASAFIAFMVFIIVFFSLSDISTFAWGHRVREITYKNGSKAYFVQQRIPVLCYWKNCTYMIGIDTYTERYYDTPKEALEFIENWKESVEKARGYRVSKKRTVKKHISQNHLGKEETL